MGKRMAILERIHLEILREVEREGTLTAAADKLHLTQSALSHSIRKLEQQLGTALWHRVGCASAWSATPVISGCSKWCRPI
jgi:DNA-binding transcriptional LysR family regulator